MPDAFQRRHSAEDIGRAFDAASKKAERAIARGMRSANGDSAAPNLVQLQTELEKERPHAMRRGFVDAEWIRVIIRDVADWAPDDDVTLLAALGVIAQLRG